MAERPFNQEEDDRLDGIVERLKAIGMEMPNTGYSVAVRQEHIDGAEAAERQRRAPLLTGTRHRLNNVLLDAGWHSELLAG